ncbi:hypothetical protein DDW08_00630 [Vulcanisaeta sp. SCGC AB-777_J10]|jgi:hypothetical protein|nr:hypothetical protein DDW08_00630 [Vulcanisaeta sp. SCGC AB-777_J10]
MSEEELKEVMNDILELEKLIAKMLGKVGNNLMLKMNLEQMLAIVNYMKYSLRMDITEEEQ